MTRITRSSLLMLLIVFAGLSPVLAAPLPIGSILGSKNAILDGQAALPNTAVLNGDSLQVNEGLALLALDQGNRMVLGQATEASFAREADRVTVLLARGSVSLYHPAASTRLQIKAGDVTVAPAPGYRTLGEVAVADGLVLVTAKDGTLQVEQAGVTKQVGTGKTITIATTAAGAPTPNPSGNRHFKHIITISPTALLFVGLAAEAGGAAYAIYEASQTPSVASPVQPLP